MKPIYKILNYDGPVHTLHRWAQEFLAYMFTCVHCPNNMMQEADALSQYHDPLVVTHILCANTYRCQDVSDQSDAYSLSVFNSLLQKNKYTLHRRKSILVTVVDILSARPLKRKLPPSIVCRPVNTASQTLLLVCTSS